VEEAVGILQQGSYSLFQQVGDSKTAPPCFLGPWWREADGGDRIDAGEAKRLGGGRS
jgi:hypothetical protein